MLKPGLIFIYFHLIIVQNRELIASGIQTWNSRVEGENADRFFEKIAARKLNKNCQIQFRFYPFQISSSVRKSDFFCSEISLFYFLPVLWQTPLDRPRSTSRSGSGPWPPSYRNRNSCCHFSLSLSLSLSHTLCLFSQNKGSSQRKKEQSFSNNSKHMGWSNSQISIRLIPIIFMQVVL